MTDLDPKAVPPGYLSILDQNRAFPIDRIIDVQGQLASGTIIYLDGGREARVEASINEVLAQIAAATSEPSNAALLAEPKAQWAPLRVEGIDVVPVTDELLARLRNDGCHLPPWQIAASASKACQSRPNVTRLAGMKRVDISSTTTCVMPVGHAAESNGDHVCVTVVGMYGAAPGEVSEPGERPLLSNLTAEDRA